MYRRKHGHLQDGPTSRFLRRPKRKGEASRILLPPHGSQVWHSDIQANFWNLTQREAVFDPAYRLFRRAIA
jgi:hypothetical protein